MRTARQKSIKSSDAFSNVRLGIFILAFSLIGIILLTSHAAPNPNLPGDLDGNNKVDSADLAIMIVNYNTSYTGADINQDGTVDGADFAKLLTNYGQSYSGGGGGSAGCSGAGNAKVGTTRGGLMGFANGYRYGQLSTADRDRYFNIMVDEGVRWTRMDMEGNNMAQWQDFVTRATNHGICVLGNINSTSWSDPPDHQAWANNAASEVSQLKANVHVWEVWNEPNSGGFWPTHDINSYSDLLHKTYIAIKNVDPNTVIMSAGPAPCGDGTNPCNPVNYLKSLYNWNKSQGRQGSSQLFDAVAIHPYGYPWDPLASANWGQSWNGFYQTYLFHQVMMDPSYGGPTNDGAKKIWGTEGGFPSGCNSGITNYSVCITLSTAASWVQPLMNTWMNDWGSFTGPFMWYELQNQPDQSGSEQGFFGFIDANWNAKQNQYSNLRSYSASP